MKILILSNKDLASNVALNQLLPMLCKEHELHLWLSAKVGSNTPRAKRLETLKFFEQDLFNDLLSPLFENATQTQVEFEHRKSPSFTSFAEFSKFLSSNIKDVTKINALEEVTKVTTMAPDLIVSIRFGGILKAPIIEIPRLGVLNLHSGILPKYKGVMATFWALNNGDKEIGTTLHTIDDGSIDTGRIVKTSTYPINPEQSYLSHVLSLYKQGTLDIVEAVNTLTSGKGLLTVEQQKSDTYFTFPSQMQCEEFETEGFKLIDEQEYKRFIQRYYM